MSPVLLLVLALGVPNAPIQRISPKTKGLSPPPTAQELRTFRIDVWPRYSSADIDELWLPVPVKVTGGLSGLPAGRYWAVQIAFIRGSVYEERMFFFSKGWWEKTWVSCLRPAVGDERLGADGSRITHIRQPWCQDPRDG